MMIKDYKIVFLSDYFNHHQKYLSNAFYRLTNKEYCFVETSSIGPERVNLGWGENKKPEYVKQSYASTGKALECQELVDRAETVMIGSAPESFLKNRKKNNQLIFRYAERPLKKGLELKKYPYRWLKWHLQNPIRAKSYLLCASAYTAADYAKFGLFKNKAFQWGYFPETRIYPNIEKVICSKKPQTILWAGRFLNWKHPDAAIRLSKRLKENGCSFTLNLIGTGPMEGELKALVQSYQLKNEVHFLGAMKPAEVRAYMEQAQIYLFTSDKHEGWGAVLNEAMNSGCAVVASHAIGSVPFLLCNQKNGLIYQNGNEEDLFQKLMRLLNSQDLCFNYGRQAYLTITTEWNAETAAERFVALSNAILSGNKSPNLFASGPCSRANVLADDWFR